jgi:hypothetical protein
MVSEITTLLAVIVGAVISFMSTLSIQAWTHRRERKSLHGALVGEISAILEIIRRRNYIPTLQEVIARMEEGGVSTPFVVSVTQEYFSVYKNNVSRLGLLRPPLPQKIATFYTLCFSIVEDLKSISAPNNFSAKSNDAEGAAQFDSERNVTWGRDYQTQRMT